MSARHTREAAPHPDARSRHIDLVLIRRGAYHDSVTLMLLGREVTECDAVDTAAVLMATPLNLALLTDQGFSIPDAHSLTPNDLVIAVRALEEAAARAAALVEERLSRGRDAVAAEPAGLTPPRSWRSLRRRHPETNLALITVPGPAAAYEAAMALEAGLHVFCFSDGVDVGLEAELKRRAADRGLLFMGPDCGTAILAGGALGFANRLESGPVGVVAASGTGAQQVTCLLDGAGIGISYVIGVGGRDLSARVGGVMTLRGLELLARDRDTEVVVVISKEPEPGAAAAVAQAAAACGKPVVLALGARAASAPAPQGITWASSLEEAARQASERTGGKLAVGEERLRRARAAGWIRGLYSGGTLCQEAMTAVARALGEVWSNIPSAGVSALDDLNVSHRHTFIDFGDDELTRGRPHPMIDYTLRLDRLRREARDPDTGVLLLDVVLGYGAHPDPAGVLAPVIDEALRGRDDLHVIVVLCGARADVQGLDGQHERLRQAGATVTVSNHRGAALAIEAVSEDGRGERQ